MIMYQKSSTIVKFGMIDLHYFIWQYKIVLMRYKSSDKLWRCVTIKQRALSMEVKRRRMSVMPIISRSNDGQSIHQWKSHRNCLQWLVWFQLMLVFIYSDSSGSSLVYRGVPNLSLLLVYSRSPFRSTTVFSERHYNYFDNLCPFLALMYNQ